MKYPLSLLIFLSALFSLPILSFADKSDDHKSKQDRSDSKGDHHGDRGSQVSKQDRSNSKQGSYRDGFRQDHHQSSKPVIQQQLQNRGSSNRPHYQRSYETSRSPSMSRPYGNRSSSSWNRKDVKDTVQDYKRFSKHQSFDQNDIKKRTQDFRSSFGDRQKRYHDAVRNQSSYVRSRHPEYRTWFKDRYYNRYNRYPNYWRNNINWWNGTPWNGVYYWLGWAPSTYPLYYYDGYPLQVDSSWPEYADETRTAYTPSSDQGDWLPLGVFSLGASVSDASNSDIFMQLAIDRKGTLSGIYYNSSTDQSYPIEGSVDANTQQASWMVPGQSQAPQMASGIYNLTQDVASVELTFPGGIVQNWYLIRINEQ